MTSVTHMATGSAIAVVIQRPILAIPLAFFSHFLLDILPHFGFNREGYGEALNHRMSYFVIGWDVIAWVILLWILRGSAWYVYTAGIIAVLPDLAWPYRYVFFERNSKKLPKMPVSEFHSRIQWAEKPAFLIVEIFLFFATLLVITKLK